MTGRDFASMAIFPVVLGGALGAVWAGLHSGVRPEVIVTATLVVTSLVILALQRLLPAVPDWRWWEGDAVVDLLHTLVSTAGASAVARAVIVGAVVWVAGGLSAAVGSTLWPTSWPLLLQLAAALLITELFTYWLHRLSHTWTPLWRLHALHHSSERLYMFSSGRNHPLHVMLTTTALEAPLVLLGAEPALLALVAAFTSVHGLLQHANIDLRLGPLNYVFATCDLHRWHHSTAMDESQRNYGNNLIVWDLVFGTWYLPERARHPAAVGLGDGGTFPTGFVGQLASPFLARLWRS